MKLRLYVMMLACGLAAGLAGAWPQGWPFGPDATPDNGSIETQHMSAAAHELYAAGASGTVTSVSGDGVYLKTSGTPSEPQVEPTAGMIADLDAAASSLQPGDIVPLGHTTLVSAASVELANMEMMTLTVTDPSVQLVIPDSWGTNGIRSMWLVPGTNTVVAPTNQTVQFLPPEPTAATSVWSFVPGPGKWYVVTGEAE